MRVGVDTGGTFTDVVAVDGAGRVIVAKLPSTPRDPAEAVLDGIARVLAQASAGTRGAPGTRDVRGDDNAPRADAVDDRAAVEVVHGTTVGTNALLERAGGPTLLVATRGFEDVLVLRRQARPRLYALHPVMPPPLVGDELRVGVDERLGPAGEVIRALSDEEVARVVALARTAIGGGGDGDRDGGGERNGDSGGPGGQRVRSIAVALLHAYASDVHEGRLGEALRTLGVPVSLSSEVLPEHREYERTSTTVVDAYVAPVLSGYLARLDTELGERHHGSLRVMQSSGGAAAVKYVRRHPVRTILSGPAAGVVGARAAAARAGITRLITFDMGGTSTDVALIDGAPELVTEGEVAGHPVSVPSLRVHTVAAGGGSIARIDEGGALKVGPRSAGALPGPACYGRGGVEATVTDALVVVGRLDPERFLGGAMWLDEAASRASVEALSAKMGCALDEAAHGVLRVATAVMARAIRVISVERGHDPRDFTLVAFGGAGGLFACAVAEELGAQQVLVPPEPGLLCAWGALGADVTRDYTAGRLVRVEGALHPTDLVRELAPLEAAAHADLDEERIPRDRRRLEPSCDLRYVGQSYELSIPVEDSLSSPESADLVQRFHALHLRRHGFCDERRAIERVALRLHARGLTEIPPMPRPIVEPGDPLVGARAAGAVYSRTRMAAGTTLAGPALVIELSGTTFVAPGWLGRIDDDGALHLRRA